MGAPPTSVILSTRSAMVTVAMIHVLLTNAGNQLGRLLRLENIEWSKWTVEEGVFCTRREVLSIVIISNVKYSGRVVGRYLMHMI